MSHGDTRSRTSDELSCVLSDETEKPGQLFPEDTLAIIRDRYDIAARLAKGKRVLEVGCGAGLGLEYLLQYSKELSCLEYSHENIKYLEERFGGQIKVEHGDAHDLPYDEGSYDLVVALAMVYYLDFPRFLCEVHRVLSPNGALFFCTSNKDVPGFCPAPYTTKYYSVPELSNELERAGFDVEFNGAFPAAGGSFLRGKLISIVKNLIKSCVYLLPGGKQHWASFRRSSLGYDMALPDSMLKIPAELTSSAQHSAISKAEKNYIHRVIYVVARKKSHDY